MKKILSCILTAIALLSIGYQTHAINIELPNVSKIDDVSIDVKSEIQGGAVSSISNIALALLNVAKYIFTGVVLIFIVYAGAEMIMFMGDNEEQLSNAKRQIWYSVVAILIINIPGTIYQAIQKDSYGSVTSPINGQWTNDDGNNNIFFDFFQFNDTFHGIVGAMEVIIGSLAILTIVYAGIRMITSRGNDETITNAKEKIIYSSIGLVFVGLIESWKRFAISGEFSQGKSLFESIVELALFFAGPTAFFFICFAGYYFITANGDEEKIKKAKSIIVNTLLAILILLASYTFLLDLITLG